MAELQHFAKRMKFNQEKEELERKIRDAVELYTSMFKNDEDDDEFDDAFKNLLRPIEMIIKSNDCDERLHFDLVKDLDSYLNHLKIAADKGSTVFVEAALMIQNVNVIYQKKVDAIVDDTMKLITKFKSYHSDDFDDLEEEIEAELMKKKKEKKVYTTFEPIKLELAPLKNYDYKSIDIAKIPPLPRCVLNTNIKVNTRYNDILPNIRRESGENIGQKYDFFVNHPLNDDFTVNTTNDCSFNGNYSKRNSLFYRGRTDPLRNTDGDNYDDDMCPSSPEPTTFDQSINYGKFNKSAANKSAANKSAANKSAANKSATNKTGEDKAGEDKAGEDKAGEDKAGKDKAGEDKADEDKADEDKAGGDQAGGDQAGGDQAGGDQAGEIRVANAQDPPNVVNVNHVYDLKAWVSILSEEDDTYKHKPSAKKSVSRKKKNKKSFGRGQTYISSYIPGEQGKLVMLEPIKGYIDPTFQKAIRAVLRARKAFVMKLRFKRALEKAEKSEPTEFKVPLPYVADFDDDNVFGNDGDDDDEIAEDNIHIYKMKVAAMKKYEPNPKEMENEKLAMEKRVRAWHEQLRPVLEQEEETETEFDVHEYGTQVLNRFSQIGEQRSFNELFGEMKKEEVARYFLSVLMLANTYNLKITKRPDGEILMELLTKERHHVELEVNVGNQMNKE